MGKNYYSTNFSFSMLLTIMLEISCVGTGEKIAHPPITESNPTTVSVGNALSVKEKMIKHFPIQPLYYIYIDHEQCFFEILVNDIPAFQYFQDGGIMSPITLNNYIAKSGKQKITYRLYPQTEREHGEGFQQLTPFTRFNLTLFSRDNRDTVAGFDHQVQLLDHANLKKEDGKTFIGAGLPYYEYTVTFDASVPYEVPALANATDLSKLPKDVLEEKTLEAYNYFRDLIANKNKDVYSALVFNSDVRQIVSLYQDENDVREGGNEDMFYFDNPTFKVEPIRDFTLKLYGDGKLVCLEHSSLDLRLRGGSAIWGKYKGNTGGTFARFLSLYLYIPKGKDTFEIW
ncbi:hypothetical protein [Sphingobacterium sp. UBA7855]|uniref:hypothetical protein n=1 Tax=Sphingobacterium sp. UBA7855 TaxID=1947526 RepID=UPI0025E87472|nr:hypothetical protein [Sphingobacterium sp. UBA7855]